MRFNFASSQEISLSNPLTPGHSLEVVLQAFLYRHGLRYLQTMLHKGGDLETIEQQAKLTEKHEMIIKQQTTPAKDLVES